MTDVALIYREQRKWTEAEELELQVLELYEKTLGPEHPARVGGRAEDPL